MKIYDCFTYFNEADVLKLRLEILGPYVDYFVIVEASKTFTGKDKPMYFDQIPNWIHDWDEKIIRRVVDFPDHDMTSWEREIYQRNQIAKVLDGCSGNDIIIISDVDEIPNLDAIQYYDQPVQLDVTQYFWNLNWQVPDHCNQGARPVVVRYENLKKTPQELRASTDLYRVPNGGWHFSFLNAENIGKQKIESFAHTEYNSPEYKDASAMRHKIQIGVDPFDRFPLKYRSIDETYPLWIQKNLDKVKHLTLHNVEVGT